MNKMTDSLKNYLPTHYKKNMVLMTHDLRFWKKYLSTSLKLILHYNIKHVLTEKIILIIIFA